ncbi:uncharacterized protein LOC125048897 [Pieris napi]|uniref:uncharacterized protein LOC125048897 n=1 Tax=Pieris napi TaxID=78633 RepID=UPI001FBA74B3|nr:uncharacterized protein LOC125048897 [Pieris napi]
MGDTLPLLPTRGEIICADVRPVLREVFRDVEYLPPLVSCLTEKDDESDLIGQCEWIDEFSSECKELNEKEKKLKNKYAERLSREPLPNIYKMYPETGSGDQESWTIVRKDLKPTIEQDAACDARLWIKNILNRSSGDLTNKPYEPHITSKTVLLPVENSTIQSYSIGEAVPPPPPMPPKLILQPPLPEYMICVPPRIEFVNFTLGNVHTESVRLINISKFELRLSVSPPKRRELDIELCSRLVVTSGSAAEFKIHYRPVDVLSLTDDLLVRVSSGKSLKIPIACYMQPPILEILVPNLTSIHMESMKTVKLTRDVLDLGSRLLGDVHRASLLFFCSEKHANFFLLPEDAWLSFSVDIAANSSKGKTVGGAASDSFWLSPVRWSGGGTTRALAVCYATEPGLHTTALRIICSTAIVRSLNVVADALWFRTDHITLEAHDKDYDIRSEDDEACEYYVRLGTAFPSRSLSATVEVLNHSPVTYPYYWSVRPWGVCSCWTTSQTSLFGEDDLCDEAKYNRSEMKTKNVASEDAKAVRVESAQGRLFPRSVTQLMIRVPDVGQVLGIHRAVLMLILKEIPKESFPTDFDPMIVKTDIVNEEGIPGVCSSWTRELCDVVCCQLEVWWEVVPVRFVLEPSVLKLRHSRRVKSTDVCIKATQLYGVSGVKANWNVSGAKTINLQPGEPIATQFNLQMQPLPNHFPDTDVIQLNAESKEWKCSAFIQRNYDTRHPSLRPAFKWLGLVSPGAKVQTELKVHNDTHQHICWWTTCIRWWGERRVANVCAGREPCPQCYERSCSCALLSPTRGALAHDQSVVLKYSVIAPDTDGVVATLVQVHRTSGDVCMVHTVAGTEARATLLAYRVLAPRVVMRIMPCLGDKHGHCKVCSLETDGRKGCAVLRPSFALTVGFRSCYRIKCSNLTPLPTTVKWQKPIDGEDTLRVIFMPNDFDLKPHSSINIQVVLDPRKVSPRRIYSVHANIGHAYQPVHLLIDAAISGLEVVIDIPLGGAENTDSFVSMKMMEKETSRDMKNLSPKEFFEEEDRKRAMRNEDLCHCRYKMMYIPPVKESPPQDIDEEYHCMDIITEPPALTRVCPCAYKTKPILPEPTETYCLQFRSIPLKTVRSRVITIRNVSSISAKITTAVRRWSRVHKKTINIDKWASDVEEPGIVIECAASQRILSPCGQVDITVSVYADCWGLYHDQVLIKIDRLDPLVLDVWIEAVGPPLLFPLQGLNQDDDTPAVLW